MKKKKSTTASVKKVVKPATKKVSAPAKKQPKQKVKVAAAAKKKITAVKKKTVVAKKTVLAAKKKPAPVAKKKVAAAKKKPVTPVKKAALVVTKKPVAPEKKAVEAPVKKSAPVAKSKTVAKKIVPEVKPDPIIPGWTKVQFEYYTRSSVGVLYDAVSTAHGLSAWFADFVDSLDNQFVFKWGGSEEHAVLVESANHEYVRFHWIAQPEGTYFEFRIKIDSITNEAALIISDYVEIGEENESQLLWDSQVHELMHILGS